MVSRNLSANNEPIFAILDESRQPWLVRDKWIWNWFWGFYRDLITTTETNVNILASKETTLHSVVFAMRFSELSNLVNDIVFLMDWINRESWQRACNLVKNNTDTDSIPTIKNRQSTVDFGKISAEKNLLIFTPSPFVDLLAGEPYMSPIVFLVKF